jgi:MEMO1 family protein
MSGLRLAAVAGAFYESHPERLKESIEECFRHRLGPGSLPQVNSGGKRNILGLVCPHAGMEYSGPAAAWAYAALAADGFPDSVIILGTNHQLTGARVAVSSADAWMTPLGRLYLDAGIKRELLRSDLVEEDDVAHESEHSIEVQLPWLQYLYGADILVFPISLGHLHFPAVTQLAQALVEVVQSRNCLVIASSDMSHYLPQETANELDRAALEKMEGLEGEGLLKVVQERKISMCGATPVAVMLEAARQMGAKEGKLLAYYTSGDITRDFGAVVGYAAMQAAAED